MNNAMLQWAQLIVTLVVGGGFAGVGVQLLRVRAERDKIHAEGRQIDAQAADSMIGASLRLLEPLEQRANQLNERANQLQRRVVELEATVSTLTDALTEERRLARREIARLNSDLDHALAENQRLRGERGD